MVARGQMPTAPSHSTWRVHTLHDSYVHDTLASTCTHLDPDTTTFACFSNTLFIHFDIRSTIAFYLFLESSGRNQRDDVMNY